MALITYEQLLRAVRSLGISLRTSKTSRPGDEVAILAGTGAPSGATYGGQTLATGQTAVAIRENAVTTDAMMYFTIDGGTNWEAVDAGTVDLSLLTAAVVDPAADSFAFIDDDDSDASRKDAIADLIAAIAGDGLTATAGVLAATPRMLLPMAVDGLWAVNGDGARTNGGGLAGADVLLTNAGTTYCKVFDFGTTTFSDVSLTSALAGFTANYQITADAANEEVGDYALFGNDLKFPELAFDLSQLATWGGDGGVWEYWNGAAYVALLVVGYDNTDVTAPLTGLRAFQQVGAVTFDVPADWAKSTEDGQEAFWVRYRITALQVTQEPILNAVEHDLVSPAIGWSFAHDLTITGYRLSDGAVTLHTAADVIYRLWNFTQGEGVGVAVTLAQDLRVYEVTGLTHGYKSGDVLGVVVVQEDGTNEITNATLEITASYV